MSNRETASGLLRVRRVAGTTSALQALLVFVDGVEVGALAPGQTLSLELPAGTRRVEARVRRMTSDGLDVDVVPGSEVLVEMSMPPFTSTWRMARHPRRSFRPSALEVEAFADGPGARQETERQLRAEAGRVLAFTRGGLGALGAGLMLVGVAVWSLLGAVHVTFLVTALAFLGLGGACVVAWWCTRALVKGRLPGGRKDQELQVRLSALHTALVAGAPASVSVEWLEPTDRWRTGCIVLHRREARVLVFEDAAELAYISAEREHPVPAPDLPDLELVGFLLAQL